ncbi:MAG: hypothetical protein MZV63_46605 [Marinilabiliales bacterium]|nr:hypothetical protein [Marinilabiliales bacterium]
MPAIRIDSCTTVSDGSSSAGTVRRPERCRLAPDRSMRLHCRHERQGRPRRGRSQLHRRAEGLCRRSAGRRRRLGAPRRNELRRHRR